MPPPLSEERSPLSVDHRCDNSGIVAARSAQPDCENNPRRCGTRLASPATGSLQQRSPTAGSSNSQYMIPLGRRFRRLPMREDCLSRSTKALCYHDRDLRADLRNLCWPQEPRGRRTKRVSSNWETSEANDERPDSAPGRQPILANLARGMLALGRVEKRLCRLPMCLQ